MENENAKIETEESNLYFKIIKELKENPTKIDDYKFIQLNNLMDVEKIINSMEELNSFIKKNCNPGKDFTIAEHMNFTASKSKSFLDPKFESVFGSITFEPKNTRKIIRSKMMDYGTVEKLIGFANKSGTFIWDSEKINDFIKSLRKRE